MPASDASGRNWLPGRIFLNELILENINIQTRSSYQEIDNNNKTKLEISLEYNKFFNSREHTFIHDLFYFQTISTYTCICGYNSYSCENLLEIPLLFPEEKDNFTLEELLNQFFEEDQVQWEDKCWRCNKKKKSRLYNVND